GASPTPAIKQLAALRVPAVVCTYFDGLVQRAFEEARPGDARAVYGVDQDTSEGSVKAPLLVHLRGSVYAHGSLVLTEEDPDRLSERLGHVSPAVVATAAGVIGRSLLFLGVSPRDAWAKRLARQLRPEKERDLGPVFFVAPARSEVDEACWE